MLHFVANCVVCWYLGGNIAIWEQLLWGEIQLLSLTAGENEKALQLSKMFKMSKMNKMFKITKMPKMSAMHNMPKMN